MIVLWEPNTILLRRIKMFNKKYKKGMADAAKAYEDFGKKQENAIEAVLQEVRQGNTNISDAVQSLKGNVDNLYSYLKSKEKADLYSVYTPFDIKNLDENERLFLVGALLRLTMDKTPTEEQQNYLRSIQKYLEIKEPPFGVDLTAIENIENINVQKAIYQSVLEYLILQEGDSYDETELQQEFLDSFNLNPKNRLSIAEHVEVLYSATGALGLAEKYGYVDEHEENHSENSRDKKYLELVTSLLNNRTFHDYRYPEPVETEDYIVYFKSFAEILVISKEKGEVIKTLYGIKFENYDCIYSHKNSICFYNSHNIYLLNIASNETDTILCNFNGNITEILFIDERNILFKESCIGCYVLNCENGSYYSIPCKARISRILNDSIVYADYDSIKKYNLINQKEELLIDFHNEILDFEIHENSVFVLLCDKYLENFFKRCSIVRFSLDDPKNISSTDDDLIVYIDEMPKFFYQKRKQFDKGWLFITEPKEENIKNCPELNLIKFSFKNGAKEELLNQCGNYPEDLIILRDFAFYKQNYSKEKNYGYIKI